LLGNKCTKCGGTFPWQAYHFHHRDPTTKGFDWTKMRIQSLQTMVTELQKCDLLCANCHATEHAGSPAWQDVESMADRFLAQMEKLR
jgi:hypothetical protein